MTTDHDPHHPTRGPVEITIAIDVIDLARHTDAYLATLWHVAQFNPAPHRDKIAGPVAEDIGREIIRRWLASVGPELWLHKGSDHYWSEMRKVATYEPGGPAGSPRWHAGRWVPRPSSTSETPPGPPGAGPDVAEDSA